MRYFFHTEDGQCFPDQEGTELPDLSSACVEATRYLGEFMRHWPKEFWHHDRLALKVTDDTGLDLFQLELSVTMSPVLAGRRPDIAD